MELLRNKYTEGAAYQIAQEITNIRKLFGIHFFPASSIYLSTLLIRIGAIHRVGPLAGITHGSRNAAETILFREMLGLNVLGTDISSSADFIPCLIRHDMNLPLPDYIPGSSLGFVFSNSWDHTNDPIQMLTNWIMSLSPDSGCLILEKQSSSGSKSTISDPFSASDHELINLVEKVSADSDLSCEYVGSLNLSYIPRMITDEANHALIAGTATNLAELEPGKMYLTDFSEQPNKRVLNHHIFIRNSNIAEINRCKGIVAALNNLINSDDPGVAQNFYAIHPSRLDFISYKTDIVAKLIGQYLLSMALKQSLFKDLRGDRPGEGDTLAKEIDNILAR
jgi:hypothetical protein